MTRRVYVTTSAEMRELDRVTIEERGVPGVALMENAGLGAARVAAQMLREAGVRDRPARVAVLAGPGNNGGDGYVVARHLTGHGHQVRVYLLAAESKVTGDARINLDAWRAMGGAVEDVSAPGALADHRPMLAHTDLLVDALFGTGLHSAVRSPYREAIGLMAELGRPVLAIDLPSGLDSDRGLVLGAAVAATVTATFGYPKRSHYLFPGAARCGRLEVIDIGIPDEVVAAHEPACVLLAETHVRASFPARPRDAHKGTFGHLLVVAGGAGKTGAALLAAQAAARSGVGLVTIAAPESGQRALDSKVVEAMTEALDEDLGAATASRIVELCAGKRALAIGPGLGQGDGPRAMIASLLPRLPVPAVLDADALGAVAENLGLLGVAQAPRVLTPHPGEMARLAGISTAEVQADRFGVAERFAREHDVILVLKGAGTVIAEPTGRLWLNATGNPGMGSGGMGDVLSGVIGALLAQGLDAAAAARLGVWAHGHAGDLAREKVGETALIASDVIDSLPDVWRSWERW